MMKTWDKSKDFVLDYLDNLCELFDCQCLTDMDMVNNKTVTMYALGWRPELNAGLVGGVLTPHFSTLNELMEWCKSEEGNEQLNKEGIEMFGEDWEMIENV